MQIAVEDVSTCRKKISVAVPSEEVNGEFKKAYKAKGKSVKLKGFRKGKIPLQVLKRYYKGDVEEEVFRKLLGDSYYKVMDENSFVPIGETELENKGVTTAQEGEELSFKILINVRPEIKLSAYDNLEFTSVAPALDESEIEKTIENLRERLFTLDDVEGRPVESGDTAKVSYECTMDGELVDALSKKDAYVLANIDAKETDPNYSPISKGVIGMSKGDKKEIQACMPNEFTLSEVAGKDVVFRVEVAEIKVRVLPEVNDEFAQKFSKSTVEELREEIRAELVRKSEGEFKSVLMKEASEILVNANSIEYPEHMVEDDLKRWEEDNKKLKEEKSSEEYEDVQKKTHEKLIFDYKLDFILSEIAKVEDISVSDAEVKERIEMLSYYMGKQKAHDMLANNNYVEHVRWDILRERTLGFVVDKSEKN